jgi:16S rRNA (cytosine967-C5)-methyltransferase
MKASAQSRLTAVKLISRWLESGTFPEKLLDGVTEHRAFIVEIVQGVIRWKRTINWIIRQCAQGQPDKKTYPFLLAGIYQLFMMEDMEDYAAVMETVEASKSICSRRGSGFVNAVLRNALQNREKLKKELERSALGIRYSHPDILINRWTKNFGKQKTVRLCEWNNIRPKIVVRPNLNRISFDNFMERLKQEGIQAVSHPFAPDKFIELVQGIAIENIPGYSEGLFYVQDPSTSVPVELLDIKPGHIVLDACAAPGGKTILIAEKLQNAGKLIAIDVDEERVTLLRDNLARLKIRNVSVICGDATSDKLSGEISTVQPFDRILLDVPCTNTGVIRRRPDVRWRFSITRLNELVKLQIKLLDCAACRLKVKGILVYSTCSLEPEECLQLIKDWLSRNRNFVLVNKVMLFPPETKTDGGFAVALQKMSA